MTDDTPLLINADFRTMELRVHAVQLVKAAEFNICLRAGLKGRKAPLFFAENDNQPPTLQRVGKGGKVLKKQRNERAHGVRRVVVGRAWLVEHMPEEWSAFVFLRMHHPEAAERRMLKSVKLSRRERREARALNGARPDAITSDDIK